MKDLTLSALSRGCGRVVFSHKNTGCHDARLDVCYTPQDYYIWRSHGSLLRLSNSGSLLGGLDPAPPKTYSTRKGPLILYSQDLVSLATAYQSKTRNRRREGLQQARQEVDQQQLSTLRELTAAILTYGNKQFRAEVSHPVPFLLPFPTFLHHGCPPTPIQSLPPCPRPPSTPPPCPRPPSTPPLCPRPPSTPPPCPRTPRTSPRQSRLHLRPHRVPQDSNSDPPEPQPLRPHGQKYHGDVEQEHQGHKARRLIRLELVLQTSTTDIPQTDSRPGSDILHTYRRTEPQTGTAMSDTELHPGPEILHTSVTDVQQQELNPGLVLHTSRRTSIPQRVLHPGPGHGQRSPGEPAQPQYSRLRAGGDVYCVYMKTGATDQHGADLNHSCIDMEDQSQGFDTEDQNQASDMEDHGVCVLNTATVDSSWTNSRLSHVTYYGGHLAGSRQAHMAGAPLPPVTSQRQPQGEPIDMQFGAGLDAGLKYHLLPPILEDQPHRSWDHQDPSWDSGCLDTSGVQAPRKPEGVCLQPGTVLVLPVLLPERTDTKTGVLRSVVRRRGQTGPDLQDAWESSDPQRGVLPAELREFHHAGISLGSLLMGPDGEIIQLSLYDDITAGFSQDLLHLDDVTQNHEGDVPTANLNHLPSINKNPEVLKHLPSIHKAMRGSANQYDAATKKEEPQTRADEETRTDTLKETRKDAKQDVGRRRERVRREEGGVKEEEPGAGGATEVEEEEESTQPASRGQHSGGQRRGVLKKTCLNTNEEKKKGRGGHGKRQEAGSNDPDPPINSQKHKESINHKAAETEEKESIDHKAAETEEKESIDHKAAVPGEGKRQSQEKESSESTNRKAAETHESTNHNAVEIQESTNHNAVETQGMERSNHNRAETQETPTVQNVKKRKMKGERGARGEPGMKAERGGGRRAARQTLPEEEVLSTGKRTKRRKKLKQFVVGKHNDAVPVEGDNIKQQEQEEGLVPLNLSPAPGQTDSDRRTDSGGRDKDGDIAMETDLHAAGVQSAFSQHSADITDVQSGDSQQSADNTEVQSEVSQQSADVTDIQSARSQQSADRKSTTSCAEEVWPLSSRNRLLSSSCSVVMATEEQLMLNTVDPEVQLRAAAPQDQQRAEMAQRAEQRRQEVERRRREREEEEERRQQQREETQERMRMELEEEQRHRAEAARQRRHAEEEEKRRREEEEMERTAREREEQERERRRQEERRRQMERLQRRREEEERHRAAEAERLHAEEERRREEEEAMLQQMGEQEREEFLLRQQEQQEESRRIEEDRRLREEEAKLWALQEAALQAQRFARQRALLEQQLCFRRSVLVEAEGLDTTQDISRPWIYSYYALLQLLGMTPDLDP